MKIGGEHFQSIWFDEVASCIRIIDQTELPHQLTIRPLEDLDAAVEAIRVMRVRGAPLIGVTAAYGLALAIERDRSDRAMAEASAALVDSRPTAINLKWAVDRVVSRAASVGAADRARVALACAHEIRREDIAVCEAIGDHGLGLVEQLARRRREAGHEPTEDSPLRILTHCNAGWLATVDWGTALSPIFKAHAAGIPVHVWVDETRPRNQGASLTAFELREMGIPHSVIVDNAGGHLMQQGQVDAVLVGSDRTTATGDVCNKIGTYLKALAAHDNDVPFFVALPRSTIDWRLTDGLREIPIEERSADEVRLVSGRNRAGELDAIELFSPKSGAANPAFDVTPARLVTALVTEVGICSAEREALGELRGREFAR